MSTVGLSMSCFIVVALLLTSPLFITRSTPFTPHPFRYTQAVPFLFQIPLCLESQTLEKTIQNPRCSREAQRVMPRVEWQLRLVLNPTDTNDASF